MCYIAFVTVFGQVLTENIKGLECAPPKSKQAVLGTVAMVPTEQDPSPGTGSTSPIDNSEHTPPTESRFILDSLPLFHLKYCSLKKNKAPGISSFNLARRRQPALSRHPGQGETGKSSCLSSRLWTCHPRLPSTWRISLSCLTRQRPACLQEKG